MKKVAIGCLVVLVVGAAAVIGVGYYGYMKVRSTVGQFAELAKVPEIERGIRVTTPFTAPATGELTATEVDKLMQVQARIRDRIGKDMQVFERNYKEFAQKKEANVTDLPTLIAAYRDLAAGWLDAKKAQVDALNEAGLSLDEYRWIRSEAYRALDIPFIDIDFGRLADQIKSGAAQGSGYVTIGGALTGPAPKSNLKFVEKYRKQLEDNMPLAAFGL